jgi:hypothetical protein
LDIGADLWDTAGHDETKTLRALAIRPNLLHRAFQLLCGMKNFAPLELNVDVSVGKGCNQQIIASEAFGDNASVNVDFSDGEGTRIVEDRLAPFLL